MKTALLILLAVLFLASCSESLAPWEYNEQTISVGLSFYKPPAMVMWDVEMEGVRFTFTLLNHGDEPADGTYHFAGTMYMMIGDYPDTFEISIERSNENRYWVLEPGIPYETTFVWNQNFDDGTIMHDYFDIRPGTVIPIRAWADVQPLRQYDFIRTSTLVGGIVYALF